MAVKSINKSEAGLNFPLLMSSKNSGCVVLFSGKKGENGIGTVVKEGGASTGLFSICSKPEQIGHHSTEWRFASFEPYAEEITLSNEKPEEAAQE